MKVTKRNGSQENYDIEKIHKIVEWATEDLNGVSISDIEMNMELSLYDGIHTTEIQKALIKSAVDLISTEEPNYQFVAARLLNTELRKSVWGGITPPRLLDLVTANVKSSVYDEYILSQYTEDEINKLGQYIKHNRDDLYTYSGLQQMIDKYLVKDRITNKVYETPQFAYMLIAMVVNATRENGRVAAVKKAYDQYSQFKISLPTPIIAGVRTPTRAYSSCYLIDVGDSLDSIFSSVEAVAKLTANRGGIGLNIGRVRAVGSSIRNSEVVHTGLIPFLKVFESTVKSTSQNAIRGGSATVSIPWWHLEIEDIVVLKNNAGTDDNRVRKLDYTIQCDSVFYERIKKNENITLFSPSDCPGLYDSFGHADFETYYKHYEKSNVRKKVIKARKLMELIARERLETGRIYIANIDNINTTSSWATDVKMTNLCLEICTPTKPIQNIKDAEAEIGVCTLSAINLLEVKPDELADVCDTIVYDLNSIIDLQEYKIPATKNFSVNRRSLGIGITNLAGFLAKNKLSFYSKEALLKVDETMEQIQYYLLDASCRQAELYGACPKFNETKYGKGLLPIDWWNLNARNLVDNRALVMPWEDLRKRIAKFGLRNSTLTAQMPVESSSVIQNSTNGAEPVRSLLTVKKSKTGTLKQLVPNFFKYRNYYDLAFDFTSNSPIIEMNAILQCWIDMAMSTNLYYNYKHYTDGKIPLSVSVKDFVYAHHLGLKTLYYSNTPDDDVDFQPTSACAGGGCTL